MIGLDRLFLLSSIFNTVSITRYVELNIEDMK